MFLRSTSAPKQAAPSALGPPRWMPLDSVQGRRNGAMEQQLRACVELIRALPMLNPPPGVYPKATLTIEAQPTPQPLKGIMMLGFWPPKDVVLRGGRLASAGEILHLLFYINSIRESALYQDEWKDSQGLLYPQPEKLGEVQGFPIYRGFGGVEVAGILVILPPGKALFTPVSQERFHRFAIAQLEKQLKGAQPALERAQKDYAEAISTQGKARRAMQLAQSLEDYKKKRPRTPEQLSYRQQELQRMDREEEERLRVDATAEGNRLTGYLKKELEQATKQFAALTSAERLQPAWHLPDSRKMGPHPVAPQTSGATPVVCLARWANPSLPSSTWQLVSIERYWMSAEDVRRGVDRSQRNLPSHLNKEVVEAINWNAFAARFLR